MLAQTEKTNNQQKAEEIYTYIKKCRGGELNPKWDEAEGKLFEFIANWFGQWMNRYALARRFELSEDQKQKIYHHPSASLKFKEHKKAERGIEDIPIHGYEINSLKSFIGAIHDVGYNKDTNRQFYAVKLKDNSLVFMNFVTHYCYPLLIKGEEPTTQYKEEYNNLIKAGKEALKAIDIKGIIKGEQVAQINKPNEPNVIGAFVATYICESNRNWVSLLTSLLQLKTDQTTFQAFGEGEFPMGGGGWKNSWSWGSGKNNNSSTNSGTNPTGNSKKSKNNQPTQSVEGTDGQETKRWQLGLIMRLLENTENDEQEKQKQEWVKLISLCLEKKQPDTIYSGFIVTSLSTRLNEFVKTLL